MYRILIVEDESEMRSLLVGYIRRSQPDLEVVGSAVNGKEALQLAEERHPDIVITDIAMPIMDGLVFLQEAAQRGLPFKTNLPMPKKPSLWAYRNICSNPLTQWNWKPY